MFFNWLWTWWDGASDSSIDYSIDSTQELVGPKRQRLEFTSAERQRVEFAAVARRSEFTARGE